jgi:DNA-binding MarR family transcriptional regulator
VASEPRECRIQQIEAAIRRHVAAAVRFDHEAAARAGLTLSTTEASFLALLQIHGPLTPGDLGKRAGISSSGTITGAIDRLERAGYVSRGPCFADRRKIFVILNSDRLEEQNAPRTTRVADILSSYDDGQLDLLTDFLARLTESETAAAAVAASAPAVRPQA